MTFSPFTAMFLTKQLTFPSWVSAVHYNCLHLRMVFHSGYDKKIVT